MKQEKTGSPKTEKAVENTGFFSIFNGFVIGGEGGIRSIFKSLCPNDPPASVFKTVFEG